MTLTELAKIAYAANRAYARQLGEAVPPWSEASDEDQQVWRQATRYHLNRLDAAPDDIQDEWLRLERGAGWSYGPKLDNEKRKHPHHVPWVALAPEHRCKVLLIRDVIHDIASCHSITPDGESQ